MKHQSFNPLELKWFIESKLGRLLSFDMVKHCSRPIENYHIVTASGDECFVKCVKIGANDGGYFQKRYVPHLIELAGVPKVAHLVHEPLQWNDYSVVIITACKGRKIYPDKLFGVRRKNLISAYRTFSDAIQSAKLFDPVREGVNDLTELLQHLDFPLSGSIKRFIAENVTGQSLIHDKEKLRIIHGDFHPGNFAFEGDDVSGIFDFEDFRLGYEAEDVIRYFLVGAEHLHWWNFAGRKKIIEVFKSFLPLYPSDEWRLGLNSFIVRKFWRRFKKSKPRIFKTYWALKAHFRMSFYSRFINVLNDYEQEHRGNENV